MSQNHLAAESSPYLLQHKDNPVHWHPWGPDALAEAVDQNKPILLSIGYAACHWCHVMAHESFEHQEVADLMNDLFINIKVDREERPDVDTIYQSALALMGQQGGWPLTMFLTPDGHPFWGGTYFPPTARWGRPGFPDILRAVAHAYRDQRDKVDQNVSALRDALELMSRPPGGQGLTMTMIDQAADLALRLTDPERGGTQGAPKFPQPIFFRFLWRGFQRNRTAALRDAVTTTLDHLCQGGIYDHVGGGFSRYSTDEEWLVPHFEKMLYDNALLIDLLTEVWQETRDPLYARRVSETIAWALSEMRGAHNAREGFAFVSAYDADSEGKEGKCYVWTEAEIDQLLGPDAAHFKTIYNVSPAGNWEGHTILNRSNAPRLLSAAEEATMRACLDTLRAARSRRVPPQRDDKVLADWNGMMIAALVAAATTFDEPSWLQAARDVFAFVTHQMTDGERLHHVWCAGTARHPAIIDDYANMARAALALFEATGENDYLSRATSWVGIADTHYWDDAGGGYFLSADDTLDVISRAKTVADHATPSGNGMMVEVLARLYYLTGNEAYRTRAELIARVFSSTAAQHLISIPGLMTSYEMLENARQIVVIGDPGDPRTLALRKAAHAAPDPLKVMTMLTPGQPLPQGHPAAGKGIVEGTPTAYVCTGPTCGLPITEATALRELLATAP